MKASKKSMLGMMAGIAACALMSSCSASMPVCATSNPLGNKVGTSSQQYILGFAVQEGGSIQDAATEAGIKKISHVDVKVQPLWPFIGKKTTIVYGE